MKKFMILMLLLSMPVLLAGCSQIKKAHAPKLEPTPMAPIIAHANPDFSEEVRTPGSLYSASYGGMFSDDKAYRRGDLLLVKVVQNTSGSKSASTDTSREASMSAKIDYLLGLQDEINKYQGYDKGVDPVSLVEASASNSFKGDGTVERTDTLSATISVIVTEVLNNGNLVVYGSEEVTLNNEASMLTVQGIVRPSDIDVENTVSSTRIANASIVFSGDGVVTEKQHPGWLMRGLDWVMPF